MITGRVPVRAGRQARRDHADIRRTSRPGVPAPARRPILKRIMNASAQGSSMPTLSVTRAASTMSDSVPTQ